MIVGNNTKPHALAALDTVRQWCKTTGVPTNLLDVIQANIEEHETQEEMVERLMTGPRAGRWYTVDGRRVQVDLETFGKIVEHQTKGSMLAQTAEWEARADVLFGISLEFGEDEFYWVVPQRGEARPLELCRETSVADGRDFCVRPKGHEGLCYTPGKHWGKATHWIPNDGWCALADVNNPIPADAQEIEE